MHEVHAQENYAFGAPLKNILGQAKTTVRAPLKRLASVIDPDANKWRESNTKIIGEWLKYRHDAPTSNYDKLKDEEEELKKHLRENLDKIFLKVHEFEDNNRRLPDPSTLSSPYMEATNPHFKGSRYRIRGFIWLEGWRDRLLQECRRVDDFLRSNKQYEGKRAYVLLESWKSNILAEIERIDEHLATESDMVRRLVMNNPRSSNIREAVRSTYNPVFWDERVDRYVIWSNGVLEREKEAQRKEEEERKMEETKEGSAVRKDGTYGRAP